MPERRYIAAGRGDMEACVLADGMTLNADDDGDYRRLLSIKGPDHTRNVVVSMEDDTKTVQVISDLTILYVGRTHVVPKTGSWYGDANKFTATHHEYSPGAFRRRSLAISASGGGVTKYSFTDTDRIGYFSHHWVSKDIYVSSHFGIRDGSRNTVGEYNLGKDAAGTITYYGAPKILVNGQEPLTLYVNPALTVQPMTAVVGYVDNKPQPGGADEIPSGMQRVLHVFHNFSGTTFVQAVLRIEDTKVVRAFYDQYTISAPNVSTVYASSRYFEYNPGEDRLGQSIARNHYAGFFAAGPVGAPDGSFTIKRLIASDATSELAVSPPNSVFPNPVTERDVVFKNNDPLTSPESPPLPTGVTYHGYSRGELRYIKNVGGVITTQSGRKIVVPSNASLFYGNVDAEIYGFIATVNTGTVTTTMLESSTTYVGSGTTTTTLYISTPSQLITASLGTLSGNVNITSTVGHGNPNAPPDVSTTPYTGPGANFGQLPTVATNDFGVYIGNYSTLRDFAANRAGSITTNARFYTSVAEVDRPLGWDKPSGGCASIGVSADGERMLVCVANLAHSWVAKEFIPASNQGSVFSGGTTLSGAGSTPVKAFFQLSGSGWTRYDIKDDRTQLFGVVDPSKPKGSPGYYAQGGPDDGSFVFEEMACIYVP
jgi:hypothetical protein